MELQIEYCQCLETQKYETLSGLHICITQSPEFGNFVKSLKSFGDVVPGPIVSHYLNMSL